VNIAEAIDLSTALRYLLAIEIEGASNPSSEVAEAAAIRLIMRARDVLPAGLTFDEVSRHWPRARMKGRRKL
jgi:hypothetical protein